MSSPGTRLNGAFTLLEVLTAMGIFCIAVLGLLLAMNVTLDVSGEVRKQKSVREELENRLARLSLPPLKEFSDTVEKYGVTYREEIRKESVTTSGRDLLKGFWRVRVEAEWKEGEQVQKWDASHLVWEA